MGKKEQENTGKPQDRYQHVFLEEVIKNIDEYIVPECQDACRKLWGKNILTFMVSGNDDGENHYIILEDLSKANEETFGKMMTQDPRHYCIHPIKNGYTIQSKGNGNEVASRLSELADIFEMQDVIDIEEKEAYISSKRFVAEKFNMLKYVLDGDGTGQLRIQIDESKMTKSIEEYLQEAGAIDLYDAERDVVYTSDFYRDMHLRYLEYVKEHSKIDPKIPPEKLAQDEKARKSTEEFDRQIARDNSLDENVTILHI